jgi:hypothetical protein
MAIIAHWHTRIGRPVEHVFDYVADLKNEPQWNPDASNVVQMSDGAVGLGTEWEEDFARVGHYVTTLARYERPSKLAFDARNPRTDAYVEFRFAPAGDAATDVSCDVRLTMKGFMRLLEPLLAPVIKRQIESARPESLLDALSA